MRTPLWMVVCWLIPALAHAHAPLARSALIYPGGIAVVRMPGFGLVVRSPDNVVSYACDALFGLSSDDHAALAERDDGSFLLGSTDRPLRIVAADGCSLTTPIGWPDAIGVSAVSRAASTGHTYFALSAETSPALYRSIDNGEHWELQIRLEPGHPITGLRVVQPPSEPAHVYATRPLGTGRTQLLLSEDEGTTFQTVEHAADLTLLDVRAGVPDQLWLLSPHPESGDVAIVRGSSSATNFDTVHRVRFFGGLALDEGSNTVWIADEAGALVRSINGGDIFETTRADLAIACLVHHDHKLWACTAGTNQEPALAVSDDGGETFSDVFSFAQVDQLVSCGTAIDPRAVCASAWSEWQRDVLELTPTETDIDAGTPPDADPTAPNSTPEHRGCRTAPGPGRRLAPVWIALVVLALLRRRHRVS